MRPLHIHRFINAAIFTSAVICLSNISTAVCSSDGQSPIRGIPSCAQPCVEKFVTSEYPSNSCSGLGDIDCLCRTNTTSGLTLGEATLSCTISFCSLDVVSSSNVYEICNSVSGALPETHPTITATILQTTSTFIPASSTQTSTSNTAYSTPSASKTTLVTSPSSTRPVTTSQSSPSTSWTTSIKSSASQSAHSSPSPSATQSASSLSTPAVVGVSVSTGISALFLAGVFFYFCVRKIRRGKSETFEIGGSMAEPPDFAPSTPRNPPPNPGQNAGENTVKPTFHNFPLEPVTRGGPLITVTKQAAGPAPTGEAIGIAITPETERGGSPESQSSQRTLSQLLPDKPDYALYPEPLRLSRQGVRPTSGGTAFEEDSGRRRSIFGPLLEVARNQPTRADKLTGQQFPRKGNGRPYPGLPSDPRALIYAAERTQNQKPHPGGQMVQLPVQQNKSSDANGGRHHGPSRGDTDWPLNDRNRRSFGRGLSRLGGRRSSLNRRSNSRNSECSDTSFESIDTEDDDGTPDWNLPPAKPLSPVRENSAPLDATQVTGLSLLYPTGNSPVKYPKMPRSASVSRDAEVIPVPRAAKLHERMNPPMRGGNEATAAASRGRPSEQGINQIPIFLSETSRSRSSSPASSLLAKRRGDAIAEKMETEFRNGSQRDLTANYEGRRPKWRVVKEVVNTDEGRHQKRGVNTDMSRTPPNRGQPESPREHNITPSRRGADLFPSVD